MLDASAVLRFVEDADGADRIERLFKDAARGTSLLSISVVNWGEVFYHEWQVCGEQTARSTTAKLARLPLELVPVDLDQALKAAELKAVHKIPFVDCIAAALALRQQATLVTSDHDFEKLGRHFPVLWIGRS